MPSKTRGACSEAFLKVHITYKIYLGPCKYVFQHLVWDAFKSFVLDAQDHRGWNGPWGSSNPTC